MESPADASERSDEPLAWIPLGLWVGGVLALVRAVARHVALGRGIPADDAGAWELLEWDLAGAFPSFLLTGVVAGLVGAAVARRAALGTSRVGPGPTVLFLAALFGCVVTGWPFGPPAERARFARELAADSLAVLVPLAATVAVGLVALSRAVARSDGAARRALAGRVPLGFAFAVALLAPLVAAWELDAKPPTFVAREVVHDFLAEGDWKVLEERPDAAPSALTITPAVAQHQDSADKPALCMPPPCAVELVVPEGGPGVLRLAAGIDRSARERAPRVSADFEVTRNGEPVFTRRLVSERTPAGEPWDPSEWVWHHVGGAGGLAVEPGDRIVLRTRLPEDDPLMSRADELVLGFGGLVLERAQVRARTRPGPESPNVVLVVMDTQRADRLSCYGYARPTTPNVDRLAARGVRFEAAYATASWTWPATASILTGLPPEAHGVTSNASCTLNLALESLPEALQRNGYTTAAFSCNPLIAPDRYFDQGFELFDYRVPEFRQSDEVVPAILAWLRAHAGVRFFLYLHLADPHTPHRPHPEELARLRLVRPADFPENGMDRYAQELLKGADPADIPEAHRRWISDQYDASVATGDRWLGVVFDELERLGLTERTVVAYTADHGEELFDHGLLAHGHTLHAELVHVPLILAGPGLPAGVVDDAVCSNRHLAPTLARLAGARLAGLDAQDLLAPPREELATFLTLKGVWGEERQRALFGLRSGPWVLHWNDDGHPDRGDLRLYDARSDPTELTDLAHDQDATAEGLQELLERRREHDRSFAPARVFGIGASGAHTIEAVGYGGGDH